MEHREPNGCLYTGTDAILLMVRRRCFWRCVSASAVPRGLVVPIADTAAARAIGVRAERVRSANIRILRAIARRLRKRRTEMRLGDQYKAQQWKYGLAPHYFDLAGIP